jgi:predicted dehydrogenase
MKSIVNIGVLGCASIAKRSIIPTIKELNDSYHLAGIASRQQDTAEALAHQFGSKAYTYDSLIDDDTIDAIYIPLPNAMHAEWIERALDKGKHVLVEKTLATSYEDVLRLNNKAKSKNLVLVESFQFRFHRQLKEIRNIIDSDGIGELRCMRSSFGFPPFPDAMNIRYQKELGGGALLDAGAYPIKISQVLLGYDLEVKAAKLFHDDGRDVDIWGGGFLAQTKGNLFSEIAFGFDHYYQCNVELWGSKGKLTATRIFTAQPNFEPEIILETNAGIQHIKVPADNHFVNLFSHLHWLINNPAAAGDEYTQNINQARLIEAFKNKANE